MAHTQYVALLRGINVGGNNIIRMADLRRCLETAGFADVATYIQSGNVLFRAERGADVLHLADDLGTALAGTFGYRGAVVVRSHTQMTAALKRAPGWMGAEPDAYLYDCIFLKEPLTANRAIEQIPMREGVDQAATGPGVIYFARLASRAPQSRLNKIVSTPIYSSVTIRNWKTTTKLVALMDGRASVA